MSINWESILPKKQEDAVCCNECQGRVEGKNSMRDDCVEALKASEARGEICKPLSVEAIEKCIDDTMDKDITTTPHGLAEAIHRAMTNKGDVCNR